MKLKPCPFCGGEAKFLKTNFVGCANDECQARHYGLNVEVWQHRTPDPLAEKVIEAAIAVREQLAGGVINPTIADVLFTLLDEPVTEYQKVTP